MDHVHRAGELFMQGYNCAQSVAMAFADVLGMEESAVARLASPFGGGMGRMREVCGAISGMLMVHGSLYGYDAPNDESKAVVYQQAQELIGGFRAQVGAILCREILANPPSDPKPTPRTEAFYQERPCVRMVMTAARLMEDFISEHPLDK